MSDADDLRDLADRPFTGIVKGGVVLTPEFAHRIADALPCQPVIEVLRALWSAEIDLGFIVSDNFNDDDPLTLDVERILAPSGTP